MASCQLADDNVKSFHDGHAQQSNIARLKTMVGIEHIHPSTAF